MDHDQRFKALIRKFFADFLRLFFREWAERFDLGSVEWLDKEILPNPPEGSRHLLDLIAKIRAKQPVEATGVDEPGQWLALVHIEVESPDRTTRLKPRFPGYYIHLRDDHGLPVLPIAIYLKVGLDGIGIDVYEERFWELSVLRFSYLYVGLPALDGLQYVQGENWLGVALAALMRIPNENIVWLGMEAQRRLAQAPLSEQEKFLLADCVDAYLPLDEPQRQEYKRWSLNQAPSEVQAMNKTIYDEGMEKGELKSLLRTIFRLGRKRFGPVPLEVETRLRAIQDPARLDEMTERLLDTSSWDELLPAN